MFDTTQSGLLKIISGGEGDTVEFKNSIPPGNLIATNLIAFSNSNGGILLIGVDDSGKIIGIPDNEVEKIIVRLHKLSISLFSWPSEIRKCVLEGKNIVYIVVEKAPDHLIPITSSSGEVYKREDGKNIRLSKAAKLLMMLGNKKLPKPGRTIKTFVAMSFREEEEPALVDYFNAIKRAIEKNKLRMKLIRMDLVEGDFEISQKILKEIDGSDIIIADFTLNSSNVYFELGYARGRNKEIIQTARKDTKLEFDVSHWKTVFYRNATELEQKINSALNNAYSNIIQKK